MTNNIRCIETVYHSQGVWGSRSGCENKRGLREDEDNKVRCSIHNLDATRKRKEAKRLRWKHRVEKKHCLTCRCY
ncbi:hypothetical protein LCGC14_2855820 [marine sediment metagenome]|uniref:Uncharacterized protein n=1 Tax=marine sediment metagenome TaxID=412755 RepID=A0A0F9AFC1_9ZZZZ